MLPGLGADSRMFHPQRAALPVVETPDWIAHVPGESLRSYARRFAQTIEIKQPAILCGVSMGGMIALEMSRLVPTRHIILIASCRRIDAANGLLRLAGRCARFVPLPLIRHGGVFAPLFLGRGGALSRGDRDLLVSMARGLPADFIRWAGSAVVEWEGCPDPGAPVTHIHGDRDWVIPLRRVQADCVIAGGMHVLNLSHPAEVNRFIRDTVQDAVRAA